MGTLLDGCAICNGLGQVAAGAACPVCGGTGVASAEQTAAYRQVLVDAAVEAATERFRQAGTSAAEGVLRGLAQARDDAKETTARAGEVLSALLEVRRTSLEIQAAALEIRSHPSAALFVPPGAPDPTDPPPDPTDPPPGITLPAGMGGEIYYFDSLLVRQLDVWGNLNVGGSGGLLTNPMTTLGDLITGAALGVPQRLGVGTSGQVLTVVGGVPAWASTSASLTNPMTTLGDIIIAASGGTPARLGAGTLNQVLTMGALGSPVWANAPSGFANPMTTLGDIIAAGSGGTPGRVPIGAAGQVLTVVGGTVQWQTNPAGFANPMTTSGDLIVATAGGTATRLPVGTANQVLQVVGGVPAWAANAASLGTPVGGPSPTQQVIFQQPDGSMLVLPVSTYGLTTDDGTWINTAFGLLPSQLDNDTGTTYTVGVVRLIAASYNIQTQVTKPPKVDLYGAGPGTILAANGNAFTAFFCHHPSTSGLVNNLTKSGGTYRLIVDGTNTTGVCIGIDIGDGNGHVLEDVRVQNFDTLNSIGLNWCTRHFWTEKNSFRHVLSWNNNTAVQIADLTASGTNPSFEYNDVEFYIRVFGTGGASGIAQTGIVLSGVHFNGSMKVRGNMLNPFLNPPTGGVPTPAEISLFASAGNASSLNGHIDVHVETNGTGQGPFKIYLNDTSELIGNNGAEGLLRFDGGVEQFGFTGQPAAPAIGQFAFKGPIDQADTLRQPQIPTFPASGGAGYQNIQCDSIVYISGGTVTQVKVDGVIQGSTTGPFLVPWFRTIIVTYTGSPAWTWTAAL